MHSTRPLRLLLLLCALVAIAFGTAILLTPTELHALNGVELGTDASLLSEIRAPGGALVALGFLMLAGVFAPSFTHASTAIAAAVYLAYGASRALSIGLDGMPAPGLVGATAAELAIGVACAIALLRSTRGNGVAAPAAADPREVA